MITLEFSSVSMDSHTFGNGRNIHLIYGHIANRVTKKRCLQVMTINGAYDTKLWYKNSAVNEKPSKRKSSE